jgi:hypothetical protein
MACRAAFLEKEYDEKDFASMHRIMHSLPRRLQLDRYCGGW